MATVLCKTLLSLYAHLPVVNKLTEKDIEDGLLRMKFFVPVMLDKNHPVEGVFRKIFLYSFLLSILPLSVYFWYVTRLNTGELLFIEIACLSWLSGWTIASCYARALCAMHSRFRDEGQISAEYPYVHKSVVSNFFALLFLIGITELFTHFIRTPYDHLFFNYLYLIILYNYIFNTLLLYIITVFIESGVFVSKGIKLVWAVSLVYFFYKLYA